MYKSQEKYRLYITTVIQNIRISIRRIESIINEKIRFNDI